MQIKIVILLKDLRRPYLNRRKAQVLNHSKPLRFLMSLNFNIKGKRPQMREVIIILKTKKIQNG
jgi:hypothetical protein